MLGAQNKGLKPGHFVTQFLCAWFCIAPRSLAYSAAAILSRMVTASVVRSRYRASD